MTSKSIRNLNVSVVLALSLMAVACQSTAKYTDRSAEITALEKQKAKFILEQEDVLAPQQFKEFSASIEKAKALNAKQADAGGEVASARSQATAV